MADVEQLTAQVRQETGSRAARRLRASGLIPAILYGHGTDPVALSLPADEIHSVLRHGARVVDVRIKRKREKALLRELQWDAYGKDVLHVDLVRVSLDERIQIEVPIELRGTSPGVKHGGRLEQPLHDVQIECLATAVPENVEVNINTLEIEDSIHVRDLEPPEGVSILTDPDTLVVQVVAPVEEEEEAAAEVPEPEPGEPQLIRREKGEEESEG